MFLPKASRVSSVFVYNHKNVEGWIGWCSSNGGISHNIMLPEKYIYNIYISCYQRNIYNFLLPPIMTFIFTRQARMPAKNRIISQINRKYKLKFRHKHVLLTVLSGVLTLQQRCCESFISSTNFLVLSFTLEF